ncbi:carboxylesterase family protein [Nocardioides marinquilinus]|uniref:Carboxylic ester hydrolase n=1 Tax=Nocardioides marinquilinus TaxID=1210400 RepID=A0ABP9PB78_9ACTN
MPVSFVPPASRLAALATATVLVLAGCSSGTDEPDGPPSESPSTTAGPTAPAADAPLRIDTTSGTWRGTVDDGVRRFRGVRYAEPPTGERRWALPEPAPDTDEVRDATASGASCPQAGGAGGGIALAQGSTDEDCLFVEITTPRTEDDAPWPVVVWWHGGGFTSGAASQYDARRLAEQGHVAVVTVNYRLGMLGYLGLPGLKGSGNFGLADQLLALRWARENAAAFGGDAENVTVYGESAGATSTCAALTSPAAEGLIDRAIFSSGSCRLAWPKGTLFPGLPASRSLIPLATSEAIGSGVASDLGCRGARPLPCLRRQPVGALLLQAPAFGNPLAYGTDLLPTDPATAIEQGEVLQVPVITGGNRDEHRSFIGGLLLTDPDAVTDANYASLVRTSFGPATRRVLRHYPLDAYDSAPLAWSTLVTDVGWSCTTAHGATDLAAAGATVYAYEFADRSAPDVSGVASSGLPQGAAHASDLPSFFDLGGRDLLASEAQRRLGHTMIDYWTSFARDGVPTADDGPEWPETTPDRERVLRLDTDSVAVAPFARDHQCGLWDSLGLT